MAFFPNKNDARERERRISSCLSRKISELGDLGSLKKLQLFCGVGGTVTACHYDAWPSCRARWDGLELWLSQVVLNMEIMADKWQS